MAEQLNYMAELERAEWAAAGLPTPQQMRAFLQRRYRRDRFEGRDVDTPGYSEVVVTNDLRDLARFGETGISRHESATGEYIVFTTADVLQESEDMGKISRPGQDQVPVPAPAPTPSPAPKG